MHPELIKAAIRMAGSTPKAISIELGVSVMTVAHVLHGRGKSARVARRICAVIGKPAAEVWPGAYPALEAEQTTALAQGAKRATRPRGLPVPKA